MDSDERSTTWNPASTRNEAYSVEKALKTLELNLSNPWIQEAIQRASIVRQSVDSTICVTRSRLTQFRSTSFAIFYRTLDSLKDLKAEYDVYDARFFANVKEGVVTAAEHPFIATGAVAGLCVLGLKGPRRFLYYRTLRLFSTEEALLSRADVKVKELKQSFERLKASAEKLEKRASLAEEEMKRGKTKLSHAGNQIRKAVLSANKIEKQARGLKDVLADIPSREASRFNSQIKSLVSEAKKERKVLAKEVTKISNYGISI